MGFIDYNILNNKYLSGKMHENVRRLRDYNAFHCLLAGNSSRTEAVKSRIPDLPPDFLEWLKVCDGGMLFDTALLSTKSYDDELDLSFDTYGEFYNSSVRKDRRLCEDWFVFAEAVHSDLFFFDQSKKDGKVYQWDVAEFKIYAVWLTFEDWLTDQINEAIDLIASEELEPLDIKLEADDSD